MKTNYLLLIIVVSLSIIGCTKNEMAFDPSSNETSVRSERPFTINSAANVVNQNGILSFRSFADFHQVNAELESKNKSIEINNAAYEYLGLNTNVDYFITENPVLRIFESELSFASFGLSEEESYEAYLNSNHTDEGFEKDEILYFENIKALFNEDMQIKIGKKYFKVYNDNTVLMVGNNDLDLFRSLSNLNSDEISTDYNVRIHQYELGDKSILFEDSQDGTLIEKNIIDLDIAFELQPNGEVYPVNKSFVDLLENQNYRFIWQFSDGTQSSELNPSKSIEIGEDVKLILDVAGSGNLSDQTVETRGDVFCDHNFRIEALGGCEFKITMEIAWSDGVIGEVRWTLPNGSTSNGTDIAIGNVLTLEIEDNDDLQAVQVTLYGLDGEELCTATKFLRCKCGRTGIEKDKTNEATIGGKKWRANVEIWCKDAWLLPSSVGSKIITKRKRLGVFTKRNADQIACSFEGTLLDKELNYCPEINIPFHEEVESDGAHLERNVNAGTTKARYEEDANICEATFWFRVGSTTVHYTKNGGKLYLN